MAGKIVKLENFLKNIDFFIEEAKALKIFVYPTDTIYGIWWIFPDTLKKVYKIKQRPTSKKVSIIWPKVYENLNKVLEDLPVVIDKKIKSQLYKVIYNLRNKWEWWTIIWYIKSNRFFQTTAKNKNIKFYLDDFIRQVYKDNTLWVRILNHPFQEFVDKLWKPFITTSANISWEEVIRKIDDLPEQIYDKVDWIIDWGILDGKPSVLIDVKENEVKIIER